MKTTNPTASPWWLMHLHNASYVLMGVVFLIHPAQQSKWHSALLGGLLLLAGICTLSLGLHRRQNGKSDNDWFILSSLRDMLLGALLLFYLNESLETTVNLLGAWALVYAFMQAIEANFYFLGTRSDENKDYGIEVIHFLCVLIAGSFAFLLVIRPEGFPGSLRFSGLLLVVLGAAQALLSHRLWRGEGR